MAIHANMIEISSVIVFFLGFYGLITSKNVTKSIISTVLLEIAVVMFYLSLGYADGMTPPLGANTANTADPLPQALVITAIIIGIMVSAVNITVLITLCRKERSTDWDIIKMKNAG